MDAETLGDWVEQLEDATVVINLAGKSVNCKKTPDNCDLILRSRVDSTRLIGEALTQIKNRPKVWIQMSTAHIYGDPPTHRCTENSSTGYGLAPFVGKAWEKTFWETKPSDIRPVILRTSFVLGKHGGALTSLKNITKMGLDGRIANGKQGFSWIHESDFCEIVKKTIESETYHGIYNISAPAPINQKNFMKQLRAALHIPIGLPAPTCLVNIGAKFF